MLRLPVFLLLLALLPGLAAAGQERQWEVGLRGGIDATGVEESFTARELYLLHPLSWQADPGVGLLTARLDLGAGHLSGGGDQGNWLAAGADLVWRPAGELIEIEGGLRPAWISEHLYGNDDFGGGLQFATHVGAALHMDPVVISYRYQHLSNAGIYHENDGLDLHLFGAGCRF